MKMKSIQKRDNKNCYIVRDLLPLYMDGICSDESKQLVKKHLEQCEACKSNIENIDEIVKRSNEEDAFLYNPFNVLKRRLMIRNIILVMITIAIMILIHCFIENVASIHDFIYTNRTYVITIDDEEAGSWVTLGEIEIHELICKGVITNNANSTGVCNIKIVSDDEMVQKIEAGESKTVKMRKGVNYDIKIMAKPGTYCIHFD